MIKILFVSDTHLGFDLPFRPRVERLRRGPDFFRMFELSLEPALRGEVDAVVHGGDILYRSKVPPELVRMAFEPLMRVADLGVPVYVVPGNHERSAIPYRLLATHPKIHIFVRPKTFFLDVGGSVLALAGFPYVRDNIRGNFKKVLEQTGWDRRESHARVLCIHHCIEGSSLTMGNRIYVFRDNSDVIRASDLPWGAAAVLTGHIHRFQVLTNDLQGKRLPVPVFYPGSTERTSFVEKDEAKGYLILEIEPGEVGESGVVSQWQFHELPARPMHVIEIHAGGMTPGDLEKRLRDSLLALPADSVVSVRVFGADADCLGVLRAESLRRLAPGTMNVKLSVRDR